MKTKTAQQIADSILTASEEYGDIETINVAYGSNYADCNATIYVGLQNKSNRLTVNVSSVRKGNSVKKILHNHITA